MQRAPFLSALALLCAVPAVARAQSAMTLKGGLSYGDVSNRGVLPGNLDTRTGFAVGLSLGATRSLLGFGLEGLYAQRGVHNGSSPDSRSLDYIDVPAYLRVTLPTPGLAPFAYAGPQASFEVRCRAGASPCPDTNRPRVSTAAVIGAGVRLGQTSAFSVEGRYIYGLTDLKLSTITSSRSYQTRSFLVLAGYEF
jgi:hypothetical protein